MPQNAVDDFVYLEPLKDSYSDFEYLEPATSRVVKNAQGDPVDVIPYDNTPKKSKEKGFKQRFNEAFEEGTSYGFPALVARKFYDYTNAGHDILRKRFPDLNDDQIEELADKAIAQAQRETRDRLAARHDEDPIFGQGKSLGQIAEEGVPYLLGQIFGSVGPETLVTGGGGPFSRIAVQGGAGAASELGYQGIENVEGVREDIDPVQVGLSGLFGLGFQGLSEGIRGTGKGISKLLRGGDEVASPRFNSTDEARAFADEVGGQVLHDADGNISVEVRNESGGTTSFDQPDITKGVEVVEFDAPKQAGEEVQPELLLGEEFRARNSDNFENPEFSDNGKLIYETTGETDLNKSIYTEYQVSPDKEPLKVGLLIDKETGKAILNVETDKIQNADEFANTFGPKAIREGLKDIITQFPEIKEIEGVRKTGAGGSKELVQKLPKRLVDKIRESNQPKVSKVVEDIKVDEKYAKNINLKRFTTTEEENEIIRGVADSLQLDTVTHRKTIDQAREILSNRSAEDILTADPKLSEARAYSVALRTTLVASTRRLKEISNKIAKEGFDSTENLNEFNRLRLIAAAAVERDSKVAGEAGRLLNSFKIIAGKDSANLSKALSKIDDLSGNKDANNKRLAQVIADNADDDEAIKRIIKDSYKPNWEDYIISVRYNMMLSGLKTHVYNLIGTSGSIVGDLLSTGVAGTFGQTKRLSKGADRVLGREIVFRTLGLMEALFAGKTWKDSGKAFSLGSPLHQISKVEGRGPIFKNKAFEIPTRALAFEDEFFRGLISNMEYSGLAHRIANKEGLKFGSADYSLRVKELKANPTVEMEAKMKEKASYFQFVDEMSSVGKFFSAETARTGRNGRVAKFLSNLILPFARTSDSLIRAALRWSPLGVFDRYNIKDFKEGGAERDQALARYAVASIISSFIALQAYNGNITGQGPTDYKRKRELEATGWQPNSIKLGEDYVSLQGLEPLGITSSVISTLVERYKNGELSDEDLADQTLKQVGVLGEQLSENTFTGSLVDFYSMFGTGPQAESARKTYVGNLASSFAVPALVRQVNQTYFDPSQRDTSGEGTVGDKIEGRILSGIPGLSSTLPQTHDVLGNPVISEGFYGPDILSRARIKEKRVDEAIDELARLSEIANPQKALVTPAPKSIDGVRLNAEDYQNYQRLSGQYIVQAVNEALFYGDWEGLNDDERIDEVQKIVREMRKAAREELFSEPDQEEEFIYL